LLLLLQLTGTLPRYLATIPGLSEVKIENNALTGSIDPAFGDMKLRRFQTEGNQMTGRIPDSFRWEGKQEQGLYW
jgi:hypothetical protein